MGARGDQHFKPRAFMSLCARLIAHGFELLAWVRFDGFKRFAGVRFDDLNVLCGKLGFMLSAWVRSMLALLLLGSQRSQWDDLGFVHTRFLQDTCMKPFISTTSHNFSLEEISFLLRAHGKIQDCILGMWSTHLGFKQEGTNMARASKLKQLKASMDDATSFLKKVPGAVSHAPLKQTMHFVALWLQGLGQYTDHCAGQIVADVVADLDQATKAVDNACPKWGTCITDTEFNLEVATIMLIDNKNGVPA